MTRWPFGSLRLVHPHSHASSGNPDDSSRVRRARSRSMPQAALMTTTGCPPSAPHRAHRASHGQRPECRDERVPAAQSTQRDAPAEAEYGRRRLHEVVLLRASVRSSDEAPQEFAYPSTLNMTEVSFPPPDERGTCCAKDPHFAVTQPRQSMVVSGRKRSRDAGERAGAPTCSSSAVSAAMALLTASLMRLRRLPMRGADCATRYQVL